MSSIQIFHASVIGFVVLGQAALLWLQIRGLQRYKHRSFILLASSTSIGLTYTSVRLFFYMVPSAEQAPAVTDIVISISVVFQMIFGVWGAAWLFHAFGKLQQPTGQ
jgi:hypothetical protein